MGELDFKDMYWQMPLNISDPVEKEKLSYLCIRTAYSTMAYSRAAMGLLGMDSYQEELTDRLFGDLVVENKVVNVADNLYFGANTKEAFHDVFRDIIERCAKSNLRMKTSKIKRNIISADI